MLDEIKQMQQNGMSDAEIVQKLREQGLPPMEINNAMEQSQIKAAVGDTNYSAGEMQPSVMQQEQPPAPQNYPQQQQYQDSPQQQQQYAYPQEYQQQQYPQEQYPQEQYPQQNYSQMQQYAPAGADNIAEIAEQIAEEKINAFRKKVGNLDEIKIILAKKIESVDERLKKIEEVIEMLQKAIINKIGSYGDSIEQIKDEMGMMQDSFSKALPGFKKHGETKEEVKEEKREEHQPAKHKGDGFEHYLRK